ncbi:MAG TPA: type II toxin-antitoxin system VapC family toxin [Ktedonobacteraceae bacterium]|nr:type II toxin-antitoxin system VapC family toxin [Ktedonobacteraceae bacterium]
MSNVVIVDASIAIKWTLNESDSSAALALLAHWNDEEIEVLAPALLAYEVTNALYRRVRKGEIPFEDARRGLTEIIFKVVEFDFPEDPDFNIRAMELGQQCGLPAAYDSHYLALAEREGCELWTADLRMWNSVNGKLDWLRRLGDLPIPSR